MKRNLFYLATGASVATVGYIGVDHERLQTFKQACGHLFPQYKTRKGVLSALSLPTVHASTSTNRCDDVRKQIGEYSPTNTFTERCDEIMRHGYPNLDHLQCFQEYVSSYDRRTRTPRWVMEHLGTRKIRKASASTVAVCREKQCEIRGDLTVEPYGPTLADYSCLDHYGYLVDPANHRDNKEVMDETYIITNIAPEVGDGLARFQQEIREMVPTRFESVYVCTGPLYAPEKKEGKFHLTYGVIGDNDIGVPTHFFKVILGEDHDGNFHIESYKWPNRVIDETARITDYKSKLGEIEEEAGLVFFRKKLDDVAFIDGKGVSVFKKLVS